MIALQGVTKRFGQVTAAESVDLRVVAGELVALLGPSGCGKTTLLRLIAGFEAPDAGEIAVAGRVVAGRGAWTAPERRRVGMVFQDYALFSHLDVAGNVGYGVSRAQARTRVPEVLELVGLTGYEKRRPHELSGGQQQRVALARALAPRPEVILLDEPWSSVDALQRADLRVELVRILRESGVTVVLVTHEREEAFALADRVALMHEGRVVQATAPERAYSNPVNQWAACFVGEANFLSGRLRDGRVVTDLGTLRVAPNGVTEGEVDAVIRPETVELVPDPAGGAEVVERSFLGHDVRYRVRLASGMTLSSQRPSTELVELGARVRVELHDQPVAVFGRATA